MSATVVFSDAHLLTNIFSGVPGKRKEYLMNARTAAREALAVANRSGDPKRSAAAMRAINYFSREAYRVGV